MERIPLDKATPQTVLEVRGAFVAILPDEARVYSRAEWCAAPIWADLGLVPPADGVVAVERVILDDE
jgi:hypothetical protein